MADLPVVLVVEDDQVYATFIRRLLLDKAEVLWARTLTNGRELFEENRERLSAIIMDGCVESSELDSLPLIQSIRQAGYTGPIFACSASAGYLDRMVEAGCSHKSGKVDLVSLVSELLGLESISYGVVG